MFIFMAMKHLLILFSLGILSFASNAQTYIPFPASSDSAVWNISTSAHEGSCRYYDAFITGDTTINNKNYVVLGRRGIFYWWQPGDQPYCSNSESHEFINNKHFAYREDSTHKIYFRYLYSLTDTNEFLLYDFGLQVGDSLKGHFADITNQGIMPIVSSIDSIEIDNNWRKKINFKNSGDSLEGCFYLIEGIGCNTGLLEMQVCPFFESIAILNCFKLNGDVKYPIINPFCNDYSYITSNEENKPIALYIYPNPASNFVSISLPTNQINSRLSIYNLTGQLVLQKPIISTQIPIADLGNGMYIFVITADDKVLSRQRVVVAR